MARNTLNINELCEKDDSHLTYKLCGYKITNDPDIEHSFKSTFPDLAFHDMPYYCDACQNHMTPAELTAAQNEMNGHNRMPEEDNNEETTFLSEQEIEIMTHIDR